MVEAKRQNLVTVRCATPAAFPLLPVASRAPRARESVLIYANLCVWTPVWLVSLARVWTAVWLVSACRALRSFPVASRCVPAASRGFPCAPRARISVNLR